MTNLNLTEQRQLLMTIHDNRHPNFENGESDIVSEIYRRDSPLRTRENMLLYRRYCRKFIQIFPCGWGIPNRKILVWFISLLCFGVVIYYVLVNNGDDQQLFSKKPVGQMVRLSDKFDRAIEIRTKIDRKLDNLKPAAPVKVEKAPVGLNSSNSMPKTATPISKSSTMFKFRTLKEVMRTRPPTPPSMVLVRTTKSPAPVEVIGCHLPKLKPFEAAILEFVEKPEPIDCGGHPLIFETDLDSNLIQVNSIAEFGFKFCCYKDLMREEFQDDLVEYSPICTPITANVTKIPPKHEYIGVVCTNSTNLNDKSGEEWLVDIFGLTPLKPAVENRIAKLSKVIGVEPTSSSSTSPPTSLVVFGLDAISHMNLMRTMPKTYLYLTKTLGGLGLDGYVKVGDNTFPNLVPVLTGLNVSELGATCWNTSDTAFDACPFIWKKFAASGFRTSHGEDAPWMSSFNYEKQGFKNPPTDYYLRPLLFSQESHIGHMEPMNAKLCYGPRLAINVLLDNLKKLAHTMGPGPAGSSNSHSIRKYFQFIWANTLSHDDLNTPMLADDLVLSTLTFLKDGGFLNHTIFVLMSDHGIRWGEIRNTHQGKIEERMPFVYFVFPKWFSRKYQSAVSNLKVNRERLTTPFDLHETLNDLIWPENRISDAKIKARSPGSESSRGTSLFLPITLTRTCETAGISEHFCVCHAMIPISVDSDLAKNAARNVVKNLNTQLSPFPQCAQLKLNKILSAETLQLENPDAFDTNSTESTGPPEIETVGVTFDTVPGRAVFECTVTHDPVGGRWGVGSVSRTNLYGNQSHCVSDYLMKKYCFC